ncbi:hypothetical protein ACJX0J_033179, partial [Zea mays]
IKIYDTPSLKKFGTNKIYIFYIKKKGLILVIVNGYDTFVIVLFKEGKQKKVLINHFGRKMRDEGLNGFFVFVYGVWGASYYWIMHIVFYLFSENNLHIIINVIYVNTCKKTSVTTSNNHYIWRQVQHIKCTTM